MDAAKDTKSQFEAIRDLIDRGSFDEALQKLENCRNEVLTADDIRTTGEYFTLYAAVCFEMGRYRIAALKARSALRVLRFTDEHHMFAWAKLYLGRILVRLGRFDEASECFTESYVFFKRSRSYSSMIFALNDHAQLHFITGNLERAVEVLKQSIDSASRYNTDRNVNIDRRNLAMVYVKLGQFPNAEEILDKMQGESCEEREIAGINRQRAIIALCRGEAIDAKRLLDELLPYFKKNGAARDIGVMFEYLGLAESELGNYRQAERLYRKVLDMPEPTVSAIAQTHRLLTDICIAQGKIDDARKHAGTAEAAIRKINERVELAALYRSLAKIETVEARGEKAREMFNKAISLFSELNARFELAMTHAAAGESGVFSLTDSLNHFDLAIQMFDKMKAPQRISRVREARERLKRIRIENAVQCHGFPEVIVAVSKDMKHILSFAGDAAQTNFNVLLTGETGTGKDLLARYIHGKSGRNGEFVPFNAAAVPNEMIEAELFGYVKGAYTGANGEREGLLERAHGGTFYLNEIADASLQFQAKLLEVLETHRIRRLGQNSYRDVDFRLIAATNKDLAKSIKDGSFREDLFYRLNGVPIHLPPLRERPRDIPALIEHFLSLHAGNRITNGHRNCINRISEHFRQLSVPGNVRELKQQLDLLWIKSGGDIAAMPDLLDDSNRDSERDTLLETLELTNWNRRQTARILGISEGAVRYRISKYNLNPPS